MPNHAYRDRQRQRAVSSEPSFPRYAIFYTPQPGTALAAFGRSWFGRANDGITLQAFSDAGLSGTSFAALASASQRYTGLHAPIRATFTPRAGTGLDVLKTQLITEMEVRQRVTELEQLRDELDEVDRLVVGPDEAAGVIGLGAAAGREPSICARSSTPCSTRPAPAASGTRSRRSSAAPAHATADSRSGARRGCSRSCTRRCSTTTIKREGSTGTGPRSTAPS